jgi:4-diphosphocytidyl-2-C-methyl-D-erythritol kinase
MLSFPNAKINIGLNIVSKRADGYHDIETIFYPIGLCDALETIENKGIETNIEISGLELNIDGMQNICIKAYELLRKEFKLPSLEINLIKKIPSGAGLGGGSSDAAFTLKQINESFKLGLNTKQLQEYALKLGSDCAFFIENKPVFAHGRGEIFESINIDLSNYFIYLVKPDIFISTAEAYKAVNPAMPDKSLIDLIKQPIKNWKDLIFNDFEKNIFKLYPQLDKIKKALYNAGAIYASMSGSGSSIYGIFDRKPAEIDELHGNFSWIGKI